MNQVPHHARDDLLANVADLMDHIASHPTDGAKTHQGTKFCRDAGDWVRGVRQEMSQLLDTFQRGVGQHDAIQTAADAADRIARQAASLVRPVREAREGDAGQQTAEGAESSAAYVEHAESIRLNVASFREQLRAERAERARKEADDRRRFVESLRREARPAGVAPADDAQHQAEGETGGGRVGRPHADGAANAATDHVSEQDRTQKHARVEEYVPCVQGIDDEGSVVDRLGAEVCVDTPAAPPIGQSVVGSLTGDSFGAPQSAANESDPACTHAHGDATATSTTSADLAPRFRRRDAGGAEVQPADHQGIRFRMRSAEG